MTTKPKTFLAPKVGTIYGQDVPMPLDAAAPEMGVSKVTLKRYVAERAIGSIIIGKRRMVRPSAIREYLKKQEVKPV